MIFSPQHNVDVNGEVAPAAVRCSEERLTDSGLFLLENGHSMFLWIGQAASPDLIQSIFNLPSLAHFQGHMVRAPCITSFCLWRFLITDSASERDIMSKRMKILANVTVIETKL